MILIISESIDSSTNDVIDWTIDSSKILRINRNDLDIISIDYQKREIVFRFKKNIISSNDISSFWYRRGYIDHDYNLNVKNLELEAHVYHHLNAEWNEIILFFNEMFDSLKMRTLGNNYQAKDRKLKQLNCALEVGLRIPKTFITSNKKDLLSFVENSDQKIVTKGINSSPSFTFENVSLEGYTEPVTISFVNSLPNTFYPSFFQENIKKQYELRIFYLNGKFYSMAIFSQKNEQTLTDVRKYDDTKPNRVIPYHLPLNIKEKLHIFMLKMNLDTGSIDMIVDNNDEFYFLEVNPNGQFGMVSTPCNYYIERAIARELV